jgi:hypothetical protein
LVSEQHGSWSDCSNAQAGMDPCWSQMHYVGFVMTRLILYCKQFRTTSGTSRCVRGQGVCHYTVRDADLVYDVRDGSRRVCHKLWYWGWNQFSSRRVDNSCLGWVKFHSMIITLY